MSIRLLQHCTITLDVTSRDVLDECPLHGQHVSHPDNPGYVKTRRDSCFAVILFFVIIKVKKSGLFVARSFFDGKKRVQTVVRGVKFGLIA
jgi:hypothetical protein